MSEQLKEFRDLAALVETWKPGWGTPEPPTDEEITRCIQVMLSRQCIYPDQHMLGRSYRILSCPDYQPFFRKYFSAMGLELHHDVRSGMVALKVLPEATRFDWQSLRLSKEQTLVLLAIRLLYEEGFRARAMEEDGTVETTTDEIVDKVGHIARIDIEEPRFVDILNLLKRKGVIALGERDPVERVFPVTILPGIEVAVPPTYVERVRAFSEANTAPPSSLVEPNLTPAADDEELGQEEL